jgi:hypothetical protein
MLVCEFDALVAAQATRSSAFLFIETGFFVDRRAADSIDLSQPVRDWLRAPPRGKDAEVRVMADVTFAELAPRLFQPYLFCHQGQCDHLLLLTDLRLYSPGGLGGDVTPPTLYPRLIFQRRIRQPKCQLCHTYAAQFVVVGDLNAPASPCRFCADCHRALHLAEDGVTSRYAYTLYALQTTADVLDADPEHDEP